MLRSASAAPGSATTRVASLRSPGSPAMTWEVARVVAGTQSAPSLPLSACSAAAIRPVWTITWTASEVSALPGPSSAESSSETVWPAGTSMFAAEVPSTSPLGLKIWMSTSELTSSTLVSST